MTFLFGLLASVLSVTVRRVLRGPRLPSWSWGFEVITCALRRFQKRVAAHPPVEQRRAWSALRPATPTLRRMRQTRETIENVPVLWLVPESVADDAPILLYAHGGSFIQGSEHSHGELCARLALASQAKVAFVDYRLAPEHPFPAALEDLAAVWRHLEARHGARQLFLAGDSSGANLVLAHLLTLRDAGANLPRAAIAISPWVDLAARGGSLDSNQAYDWASAWMLEQWAEAYVASQASLEDPRVSPLRGDLRGLPPLHVLVGSAELLVDQVRAFVAQARAAGVRVQETIAPDMVHGWMSQAPVFPRCQDAIDEVGRFVLAEHRATPELSRSASPEDAAPHSP